MNFRNKKLVTTARIIFGGLMLLSGLSGLLMGPVPAATPPEMIAASTAFGETGIFHMVKLTELIAGVMLLFNILPALATIFLAPVAVGILVVNATMTPTFLPIGLLVVLFTAYFGYVYWNKYQALFKK